MIGAGALVAAAAGFLSSGDDNNSSILARPAEIKEAPGGSSSPFFVEQNKQAGEQRAQQAIQSGGSALPTPIGNDVNIEDLTKDDAGKNDPLTELRAEAERLRVEQQQRYEQMQQQMQPQQQQVVQQQQAFDDSLAQAMQKQMQELMGAWAPKSMQLVDGAEEVKAEAVEGQPGTGAPANSNTLQKDILIPAGTINYGQLLIEANTDIPGPVLVHILSGPFKGGRAIGQFQALRSALVLRFNLISFKNKDYAIDAIALDPDTTLPGMATEIDRRYFDRVVLPAAADFISGLGNAMSQGGDSITITGDVVIQQRARRGLEEGLYEGLGGAADTVSSFLKEEASQIQPLIRVAAGTPVGVFFLTSVTSDNEGGNLATVNRGNNPGYGLPGGYGMGVSDYGYGYDPYAAPYGAPGNYGASGSQYPRVQQFNNQGAALPGGIFPGASSGRTNSLTASPTNNNVGTRAMTYP
jgi:intracellular multiplication protein IcmE